MIVSIHQPNYLPYLGFFNKIKNSDMFILLDDAQYVKNDFHNRNRIKTPDGEMWLTIPIQAKDCFLKKINEVHLPKDKTWAAKQWKSIEASYKKAEFFLQHSQFFEEIYANPPDMLIELNEKIIRHICSCLKIKTKIVKSSELPIDKSFKSNELLIELIKKVNGDAYITGTGRSGKDHYFDDALFLRNNINVIYQKFEHPVYKQLFGEFIPNLSAIDGIFNVGEGLKNII